MKTTLLAVITTMFLAGSAIAGTTDTGGENERPLLSELKDKHDANKVDREIKIGDKKDERQMENITDEAAEAGMDNGTGGTPDTK